MKKSVKKNNDFPIQEYTATLAEIKKQIEQAQVKAILSVNKELLAHNIQRLLLEMGKGFAFVGRQYHLEVSNKDYYIDLLFYHYKLRCFVVVELKSREFDPRDAGQINFYLSAVDDLVRSPEDRPTIGLLLCKTKDNFTAEYALRNLSSPIGIAEYETEILKKLPKELKSSLPTVEEIEAELEHSEALEEQEKLIGSAK